MPFQERDAYTYATTPKGTESAPQGARRGPGRRHWRWITSAKPGCLSRSGAPLRLAGRPRSIPWTLLTRAGGGRPLARRQNRLRGVRVRNVSGHRAGEQSKPTTDRCMPTTWCWPRARPILNRGLYFAKLKPQPLLRRGPGAARNDAVPPDGMYLSVEQPVRSTAGLPRRRPAPAAGRRQRAPRGTGAVRTGPPGRRCWPGRQHISRARR